MTNQVMATVVGGELKLDDKLEFPDSVRVKVTVEAVSDWREKMRRGVEKMEQFAREHPIHLGGQRFTRDELYERD